MKVEKRKKLSIELLKRALLELMQEKDISKISIKELCLTAGINRSTFYTYYDTQYALLNEIETETLAELIVHFQDLCPGNELQEVTASIRRILRYMEHNSDSFHALLGPHGDPGFHEKMITANEAVIGKWNTSGTAGADAEKAAYLFATCGGISVINNWIMAEDRMPATQLARLLGTLICKGYMGIFK